MNKSNPNAIYPRSTQLWTRAINSVISGVQTISKHPDAYAGGAQGCPIYAVRAEGAYFEDADGNLILDYPLALGAVVLGHAHPVVNNAVAKQLAKGCLYSLSSPLEVELAELVQSVVPCAGKVRFFKSGSEATSAAVRMARAVTEKTDIAVCGYHGWHDWTAVRMPNKNGIPACLSKHVHVFSYNDISSLECVFNEHQGQVAAVIMEPVSTESPTDGFLEKVQKMARANGALLIFDEMITGFRVHPGGAQALYGVTPDMATFGKAMSNGLPIGMLAADAALASEVENKIFLTSTYGGDTLALSAAIACIQYMLETNAQAKFADMGQGLMNGLNAVFAKTGFNAKICGLPHKSFLAAEGNFGRTSQEIEAAFRRESLSRGHFLGYGHFVSLSHTPQDINNSIKTAEEVCTVLLDRLKSESDL